MEPSSSALIDLLKTALQYPLPHHLLSRLMFAATRVRSPPWKDRLIRRFIRHYGVDMGIAEEPDPARYPDFNSFFTRALCARARPVIEDPRAIACPVDGTMSQVGDIRHGCLYQAKGRDYSLSQLLADDPQLLDLFTDGKFMTLYLSPKDYHRIHMPLDGKLNKMIYVPGRLFAVNPPSARVVPNLFARNERLINLFEIAAGPMALIMVGAIFVGSMETVWAGRLTPASKRTLQVWYYDSEGSIPTCYAKGAEIGRFNMGSTVILLFSPHSMRWSPQLQPGAYVQMGQEIGRIEDCSP